MAALEALLNGLAGFFATEFYVQSCPHNFYARAHADSLWDEAHVHVGRVLARFLDESDAAVLASAKFLVVVFVQAIQVAVPLSRRHSTSPSRASSTR